MFPRLGADVGTYDCLLIGGDTVATPGPLIRRPATAGLGLPELPEWGRFPSTLQLIRGTSVVLNLPAGRLRCRTLGPLAIGGVSLVKTSRFPSPLSSANERLNDRTTM